MKLLVCVKRVPDAEALLDIAPDGRSVVVAPDGRRMNRFDVFAVEEALRIKTAFPGATVEAITVGPAGAADVLRRALAMGADGGIHILFKEGEADPLPAVVAALIAACVRDRGYDLILAGVMAEDDMQAQTGPLLAEGLGIPCATAVVAETLTPDGKQIRVERELEGGRRAALEMPLPALIAVQSGINRPRYPALSHVLRSRTQPLETVPAETLPVPFRRERILRLIRPESSGKALFLSGTAQEKANRLAELFRERALL
jgi:electron transfer flavoprotein beta subunit